MPLADIVYENVSNLPPRQRIWTPPRLQTTRSLAFKVRLLTYIRSLMPASVPDAATLVGYSRASFLSVYRAFMPRSRSDFTSAGSTCWPSNSLFGNRGWYAPVG